MKFRVMSDLHLEFSDSKFDIPVLETDSESCLILAGDIGVNLSAMAMVEVWSKQFKYVVYVCGNHEYYYHTIQDVVKDLKAACDKLGNVFLLEKEYVKLEDYVIWGATFWTDAKTNDPTFDYYSKFSYNDFRTIKRYHLLREKRVRFDISCMRHYHDIALSFLKPFLQEQEDKGSKVVIVTHHHMSYKGVADRFKGDDLNCLYYTNYEWLFKKFSCIKMVCSGHMHNSSDYELHGTRFICNPRGYEGHSTNKDFDVNKVIDL